MTDKNPDHPMETSLLEALGAEFARGIRPVGSSGGKPAAAELRRSLRALEDLHDALALQWADVPSMPEAVRWLLDNDWLLRREGHAALRELAAAEHLRFAEGGTLLQLLCTVLLRSGGGLPDDAGLLAFLRGVQQFLILEREELNLLSCGLKWAVISEMETLYRALAAGSEEDSPAKAAALFTALRELGQRELYRLIEKADLAEQTLMADPAGIYPQMSRRSRGTYRRRLSELARRHGLPEYAAARKVLMLAESAEGVRRHVGWWLLREPLGESRHERSGSGYIAVNVLLTLFLSLLAGFAAGSAAAALALLIPVSELVKQAADFLLLHFLKPVHLPRLALKSGVPDEGRTLCVISVLLTTPEDGPALARTLEETRLLNRDAGRNLCFALLADLPESNSEPLPRQAEILHAAAAAIDALNARYGGGFFLLTRLRRKNADGRWCGWERKRGALLETMRFLRGRDSGVTVSAGDASMLENTAFLLVLDSDTRTVPGAAKEMIGAMLHPLNRPRTDRVRGIVTEGYGILAPRIGVTLSAAGRSDFSRIFAGQGGCDPYGGDCSEIGMDLTGRGSFAGKGIIDIDAYLQCLDGRIPENRTLSHDAVEGAVLRCGFLGDVEVSDGFPGGVLPYYRRLERWTRGDWQNCIWLLRRGRALTRWERWKLFDSLRRSLVPIATLTAFILGIFSGSSGLVLSAAAALTALLSELLLTAADTLLRRDVSCGVRYRSALFVGLGGGLVRTFLRLLLLPAEAWVCFSAALRALWRMGVSRKHLLQWQTAAQSEAAAHGLLRCVRELWFAPVLGALLIALSPNVIGVTAGVLWLLVPLCARLLSLPAEAPVTLTQRERDYLTGCARDTWRYFSDFLTAEDHWLPPDNHQASPPTGTARRTSPTNIGFALLSVLSAADLGFLSPAECLSLLENMISTLEALPKWNGHFYNWYDTATCLSLEPRYVSTVDSGNLCACLIALSAGLSELGAAALSARAKALADAMDFRPLYDEDRKLFLIGREFSGRPSTDSRYDLMASEARLTAYLAVARGDVPKALWKRMSRVQKQYGNYRGMASWTGTMFEYLMPELLLPLRKNSLLWESARFCLFVQRRRVRGTGLPWGVSESAYRALDPGMSYRYKAHGCGHLALKRGMDEELVISPYSSFLALCVRPHAAIANLQALEKLGLRGKRGFWEALDCTPSRLGPQREPRAVRCVMAHHAGMSLVAAANLLTAGNMQRRFLSDPAMAAYTGLLEERIPVGGSVLRTEEPERRSEHPRVPDAGTWTRSGNGVDFRHPACCLLASETYSLLVTESGLTRPRWGQIAPYLAPRSPLDREKGVEFFWETDGGAVSLLPDAYGKGAADYGWQLATDGASVSVRTAEVGSVCSVSLPESDPGECRTVRLTAESGRPLCGTLGLRFRPLLVRQADYDSHPAFCGLGISAKVCGSSLLLRRLPRGSTGELWLCLRPSRPCSYELTPGAGTGRTGQKITADESEFFLTRPTVTALCPLSAEPGGTAECRFALALAYSEAEALESAERMLHTESRADLPRSAAAVIGLPPEEIGAAFALLPSLCFPTAPAGSAAQEALWPFGISGDLPILFARYGGDAQLADAKKLMDAHLFLCGCGCDFDLVLLSRDGADYHRPLRTALADALWHAGGEILRDARGGVHLIEDGDAARVITDAAVQEYVLGLPAAVPDRDERWRAAFPRRCGTPLRQSLPRYEWRDGGQFVYYVNRSLPPRAWQQVLSNGRFGFVASDCGTGHIWTENAREVQLTPWRGDPYETEGPEQLWLELPGGERVSLFAAPEDTACRVRLLPGAAVWEKRLHGSLLRTTAFVPADTDARVLLIETDGLPEGTALHWQTELLLGSRPEDARFCRTAPALGGLLAENIRNGSSEPFFAFADAPITRFTCDRAAALALDYDGSCGFFAEPVFAAKLAVNAVTVLVCGCGAPEHLRALAKPEAAKAALERTLGSWRELTERLTLYSPDQALNRIMNGWCAYQVIACRMLGRCSIYQSGGAYGFRDQLQDAVNLIGLDAAMSRTQLLRACTQQYAEGDVQHWWHEVGGVSRGVRTRCSDDLLWLPWAVCEYVEKTGDLDLCAEQLPYLASPVLEPEEKDRYETPPLSDVRENVLRHCFRAFDRVIVRGCGPHGLLRIGSGDWNDGFDAVNGESQWLSWFFLHVSKRFSALCDRLGQTHDDLDRFSAKLKESADRAWDGEWYLRGYYADGSPLGSHTNAECQIDSVAQSWAVLSGCADPEKANAALTAALERLFDREHGLIKLFSPPFAGREKPGYVASYGPGFRENGGQYTHGALWLVLALLRVGRRDEAWELLSALLPGNKDISRYLCEPFVIAADVYAAPGHKGEGGWSWYTGSAGWLWRIVTEELLGLKLRDGLLYIEPQLPESWPGCAVRYFGHDIAVCGDTVRLDGRPYHGEGIRI